MVGFHKIAFNPVSIFGILVSKMSFQGLLVKLSLGLLILSFLLTMVSFFPTDKPEKLVHWQVYEIEYGLKKSDLQAPCTHLGSKKYVNYLPPKMHLVHHCNSWSLSPVSLFPYLGHPETFPFPILWDSCYGNKCQKDVIWSKSLSMLWFMLLKTEVRGRARVHGPPPPAPPPPPQTCYLCSSNVCCWLPPIKKSCVEKTKNKKR